MPLPHSVAAALTCNDSSHYMYDSKTFAAGMQVAEYMGEMAEDSEENYNKHFSQFIAAQLAGEDLEDTLKEVWDCNNHYWCCCVCVLGFAVHAKFLGHVQQCYRLHCMLVHDSNYTTFCLQ